MEAEIAAIPTPALNLPTLEEFLKTPIGRKMPSVTRMVASKLASGDAPEQIARTLGMPAEIVNRHIKEIIQFFPCQQPQSAGNGNAARPTARPSTAANFGARRFMVEAKCDGCGTHIGKGNERVVLAAFAVDYTADEDWGHLPNADLRSVFHYCESCGRAEELRVRNPWRVHWTPEQVKWAEECQGAAALEAAEESAKIELLEKSVVNGDMHGFNKARPIERAKRDDLMARAVPFSQIIETAETRRKQGPGSSADDERVRSSEVVDPIASTSSPDYSYAPSGSRSAGEASQRAKVLGYLNSSASKGKFPEDARKQLRMWAEGASQKEVERKLGVRQGTLSKRIRAALAAAYKEG
jgi:hypothetical protein